jgi:hypothetical protein
VKSREVGRTVDIMVRIVAAMTNVFVIGDASSRDGRWSVGGEVDWQGLRRHVGCKRAASSARLSVGPGRDQVDVFIFDRHLSQVFGSFWNVWALCAARLSRYNYCTYLHHVPMM